MRATTTVWRYARPFLLTAVFWSFADVSPAGSGVWTTGGPSSGGPVYALAIDPSTPATVYAGTAVGGAFKSTDSGGSWTAVNAGLTNLAVMALAIDPSRPATLYAGTNGGGVFKSTNSGGTWTATNSGLTNLAVTAIAIDPSRPATLYAGTDGDWVFKSTNSGATWTLTDPSGWIFSRFRVRALAVDPTTATTLYAAADRESIEFTDRAVFKSTDAGATWTGVTLPSLSYVPWILGPRALAIDPANTSTLYAGTYVDGILKSSDSGATWTFANSGLIGRSVPALAIDPANPATLYAASEGVFRSMDAGSTWTPVNNGLVSPAVTALALDPTGPTTLYAGLSQGGVWQASRPAPGVFDADLALTLSDAPDPVTGTTPLSYTLGVVNAGPGTASAVSVVHTLPVGVTFDSAGGFGWSCGESAGVVTCSRDSVGPSPGLAPDITVRVTPAPGAAVLVSSASVSSATPDPNPANNTASQTTTVDAAQVWMATRTKTALADAGEYLLGSDVTYTITLTNGGPALQADNPGHELEDVLPASLTLVSASASSGTTALDIPGNAVSWDGSLASGGSVTLTIHATIEPTGAPGPPIANQATIHYDADGNGTNEAPALTDDPALPGPNDPTSFVAVTPPMDFYTVPPCRLVDTRDGYGPFGGPALAPGTRVFVLAGECNIPSTARAVSLNLTVTGATTAGNLRLYPAGTAVPLASSVNFSVGQTRANNAVALLNDLGELAVQSSLVAGTVHLILDVNGYFQ
jgi:uncharacterized repeat protein (TIGR01451 family)